jgi:hypothetical protein
MGWLRLPFPVFEYRFPTGCAAEFKKIVPGLTHPSNGMLSSTQNQCGGDA